MSKKFYSCENSSEARGFVFEERPLSAVVAINN